jgi:DNA-binding NarL/FixJ family response regulator
LRSLLSSAGYNTWGVETVRRWITPAQSTQLIPPHLVLLEVDSVLSRSAVKEAQQIREFYGNSSLPIIVVTVQESPAELNKLSTSNAINGYISLSSGAAELLEMVRRYLP